MSYEVLQPLTEKNNSFIVQDSESGKLCVKKTLSIYDLSVYQYLMENKPRGVPRILDYVESSTGLDIYEEYISGQTLSNIISERGPFSVEDGMRLLSGICEILSPLHRANPPIVHRDIKPSNILISDSGEVYLLDFNAATQYSEGKDQDTVLIGTTGYAAPEQYGFQASDPRADVYALGRVSQDIFTGEKSSPENYHGPYKTIIQKCLKLDPDDRFSDAGELLAALLDSEKADSRTEEAAGRAAEAAARAEKEKPVEKSVKHKWYIPPGFRTRTPWKMAIAIPVYIFFTIAMVPLGTKNEPIKTPADVLALLMLVTMALFVFNYMGIQDKLPLSSSSKPLIRVIGIVLYSALIFLFYTVVSGILSDFGIISMT